jgi:predicted peptidase
MASAQTMLAVLERSSFALLAALGFAACNSSSSTPPAADAGITVIPPLAGQAASNELQFLERIRHLPRSAAFERRAFASATAPKEPLRYLLFKPKGFQPGQTYPLVLSLHGGAPRRRFEDLVEPYLPGLAYGLGRLISDDTQQPHPCFVVAPWSNNRGWDNDNLRLVMDLLGALEKEFKIDATRIYVTGQSMGGWGTWSIITQHPERFAAAVPICGGGEPGDAARAKNIPIWAFHGTADHVVPVLYTRLMIAALRKAGSTPLYWEYKDADHAGTAERAYSEPDLIDWLFAQRKGAAQTNHELKTWPTGGESETPTPTKTL